MLLTDWAARLDRLMYNLPDGRVRPVMICELERILAGLDRRVAALEQARAVRERDDRDPFCP